MGAPLFNCIPEDLDALPPGWKGLNEEYGFKSKDEVYEWIYKASFKPMKDYRTHSWPDVQTNSWLGIERTSGKPWKELPEDYMVPFVNDPYENCIIVTSGGEEYPQWLGSRRPGSSSAYSIDAWR